MSFKGFLQILKPHSTTHASKQQAILSAIDYISNPIKSGAYINTSTKQTAKLEGIDTMQIINKKYQNLKLIAFN